MNFYEKIKEISTGLSVDSKTFMYPMSRYESQSLNFSVFPVIIINTAFTSQNTAAVTGGAIEVNTFEFRVLTNDSLDNWDAENNEGTNADGNSYALYLEMKQLANSIMQKFRFSTTFASDDKLSWSTNPIFKETSNALTGVLVSVSFSVPSTFICS